MRLVEAVTTPMPLSPEQFGAHVASQTEKWAKVVKFTGIQADSIPTCWQDIP
jgi:hypothetical protein